MQSGLTLGRTIGKLIVMFQNLAYSYTKILDIAILSINYLVQLLEPLIYLLSHFYL